MKLVKVEVEVKSESSMGSEPEEEDEEIDDDDDVEEEEDHIDNNSIDTVQPTIQITTITVSKFFSFINNYHQLNLQLKVE